MCDSVQAANASLLEEHFEEVSFLWSQWRRAKSSVTIALRDLRALEERIESHAQALGVYGQDASGFLRERLANKDPLELWGVAWLWMRQGTPDCGKELVKAFEQCTSPQGRALILEAVARSPDRSVESELQALLAGDEPVGRVQRLQLAAWRQAAGLLARLEPEKLLRHTDQNLQLSAWRNMALCPQGITPELTLAGALDDRAEIRELALTSAAWASQDWVLDHCRRAAAKPSLEHQTELRLLAILATEKDEEGVLGLAAKPELGALRCQLLGSYAQKAAVPLLLVAMAQPAPTVAAAAGIAFTRITGQTLKTVGRATLPPKNGSVPDEFEKEFLEEVYLPDVREAEAYWLDNHAKYQPGKRYSQGRVVPETAPFDRELDIVSIREACLRAAFEKKPAPRAMDFEHFPISQLSTILNLKQ